MPRIVKGIAVALAVVVGAVAAFFGALVAGAILLVVALLALLGRGHVKVQVNRGAGVPGPGARRAGAATGPVPSGGDVIDIEARKVETPPELK